LEDSDISVKDNLEARKKLTRFRVLERLVIAIIVVIAVGAILMTFESIKNIGTSLLASAGVAGIIIGFAAQRSIATFLAGIQIALTQPIRLEDAVVVEGEWGWIEEITFTYVVIRIWDRRRLIVPINYFIENPFQNWTRNSADILGPVVLYTDYRVPVSEIREELDRILSNTDLWNGDVKVVQVVDTTEKTVIVRILVSGADSPTTWDLRVHVREKMVEFLTNNYPESLPHSRIELRGGLEPDED
jgi:small-conductance mechanosensitive channel